MSLIGIISNSKTYENLKHELCKNEKNNTYQFIHIRKQSLENIRNIKFDVIIITTNINNLLEKKEVIEKICVNSKYLLLNADVGINLKILQNKKITVITYGLNQKSTVTISSIKEDEILIALQRTIKNLKEKNIEIGEKRVSIDKNSKLSLQDLLAINIIFWIYENK